MQVDTKKTAASKAAAKYITVARPAGGKDFVTKTLVPGPDGGLTKKTFTLRDGTTASIKPAKTFDVIERVPFDSFAEAAAVVQGVAESRDGYLLRGAPAGDRITRCERSQGTLPEMSHLLMIDLDGFHLPPDRAADPANGIAADDAEGIGEALRPGLPAPLRDAAFLTQLTTGHGLSGDGRVHLLFFSERPISRREALALLGGRAPMVRLPWSGELVPVDVSTLTSTQPCYIADPIAAEGAVDPLAGRRWGVCIGDPLEDGWLRVPPAEVLEAEAVRLLGREHERVERIAGVDIDEDRAERRLRAWLDAIATPVATGGRRLTLARAYHKGLDFGVDPDVCAAVVSEWAEGERSVYGEQPVPNLAEPLGVGDLEGWLRGWLGSREDPIGWAAAEVLGDDEAEEADDDAPAAAGVAEGAFNLRTAKALPVTRGLADFAAITERATELTVWGGLVGATRAVMMWGDSHAGKSTLLHAIVEGIALGAEIAGLPTERVGCCWLPYEDGTGCAARYRHGVETTGVEYPFLMVDAAGLGLPGLMAPDADLRRLADLLHSTLVEAGKADGVAYRIVVVDSLQEGMRGAGDPSSNQDISKAVRLVRLLQARGYIVVMIHHSGKDMSRGALGGSFNKAFFDGMWKVDGGVLAIEKNRGGSIPAGSTIPYRLVDTPASWVEPAAGFEGLPRAEIDEVQVAKCTKAGGKVAKRKVPNPGSIAGELMRVLRERGAMKPEPLLEALTAERAATGGAALGEEESRKLRRLAMQQLRRWRVEGRRGVFDLIDGKWTLVEDCAASFQGFDTEA